VQTPEILNTDEAAEHVRLSKPTLERYRVQGGGPCYAKFMGAVRYRRTDLDDWVASRLVGSTSETPRAAELNGFPARLELAEAADATS
jgi:hypothetical protein